MILVFTRTTCKSFFFVITENHSAMLTKIFKMYFLSDDDMSDLRVG